MKFVRLLPVIFSFLLLSAHFSRADFTLAVAACLVLPFFLLVRKAWLPPLLQIILVLGSIEWLRTLAYLARQRIEGGEPWLRLAAILGAVALFTAASACVFSSQTLKEHYRS